MKNLIILMLLGILGIFSHISHAQDQTVVLRDVILRYEAEQEFGTVALVICNSERQRIALADIKMSLTVDDTQVEITSDESLEGMMCMHYYAPDSTFATFGITQAGTFTVTATLNEDTLQKEVMIPQLTTIGQASSQDDYVACREQDTHRGCFHHLYDTPATDPAEIKLQLGEFFVIAPAEYESVALFYTLDLAQCMTNVLTYFGLDLSTPQLTRRLVVDNAFSGSYAGIDFILTGSDESFFRSMQAQLPDRWQHFANGGCADPHETTHIVVAITPIPVWMNEGLATFMEDTSRTNYRDVMSIGCLDGKFVSYYYGNREEIPFMSLQNAEYDFNIPGIYYYWTGACFWEHIRVTYGDEAIAQIIQRLVTFRNPVYNGCPFERPQPDILFLRDVVVPIIGADIITWTQANLDVDETYTGCEQN